MALSAGAVTPAWTAAADETDGTLTVIVDLDGNGNGSYDADTDTPQPGIGITVSDSAGLSVDGKTGDDGKFVLDPSTKLSGGRYFVVAEIPAALDDLTPVPESADFQAMSTTVDVTSEAQSVRMGVAVRTKPTEEPAVPAQAPPPAPARVPEAAPVQPAAAPRFAVGDMVWRDTDKSGQQDSGESPASGVSVQLLDGKGDVVKSTVSSGAGRYVFDRLAAGTYSVRFAGVAAGFKFATAGRGGDRSLDSDPDYTGETPPFSLGLDEPNVRASTAADHVTAAYINPTIDAGLTPIRYAIANQVWLDVNRDGVRQPAEPGATAKVDLLNAQGDVLATTATDGQGHYQFSDLPAGRYRLRFTADGAHRALTGSHVGRDDSTDSDANATSGLTAVFELNQNTPNLVPAADVGAPAADLAYATLSAGVVGVYSVGDTVWLDNNGNGVLDAGDAGLNGVRVELLDPAGRVVGSKVTNSNGRFTFDAVPAGDYRLKFVSLPAGLVFAPQHVGGNSAVDSDADAQGVTPVVTLGDQNPADTTIDAGVANPANVRVAAGVNGLATPRETVLSSTGGVAVSIPVTALIFVLAGAACLEIGRRGGFRRR